MKDVRQWRNGTVICVAWKNKEQLRIYKKKKKLIKIFNIDIYFAIFNLNSRNAKSISFLAELTKNIMDRHSWELY